MPVGLPVSRLVSVSVTLDPQAAAFANLNSLIIVGDSDVIDVETRIAGYADISEVATAFGTSAPEYKAALLYFSQAPKPNQLYIGRWAQAAVAGRVIGSTDHALLSAFTAISNGSLKFSIDGASAATFTSMNFSAATNLNGVAAIVDAALTGATCTYDGSRFVIKSSTTGASSAIAYPTAPASGTDLKTLMALTAAVGARSVNGIAAEDAIEAVAILDNASTYWYALMFASTNIVDADHEEIAAYIEATSHLYGLTTQSALAIDATSTTDIGYILEAAGYKRTFGQYSSTSPYAVASLFGRILTTDFNANNTVITLMYKQEPGVTAETLTTAQASALDAKRYNYFVNYDNGVAIVQNGTCFGDCFVDEIYGADWFANSIQTNVFNLMYTSKTKIPQTDSGNVQIANAITDSCAQAVTNGLIAAGTWTSDGFGQLSRGDTLTNGFYVYTPPIALQPSADRALRKSVAFQVAGKLAGAIHTADILVNLNR